MKKYSFRLQTVLEMREQKLEGKRREMAKVIAKLNEQNEELQNMSSKKQSANAILESIYEGTKSLDIMEVTNYKDFLGRITGEIKTQELLIEKTTYQLQFKQLEVTNALKEVKILEKLKETQEKKFYDHYNYVEAKEIDDIASTRYKKVLL